MEDQPIKRMIPARQPGESLPVPKTHQWSNGEPVIEGIHNVRYDTCKLCSCVRRIILRVGMHPWTDGYTINGSKTEKAPPCNK